MTLFFALKLLVVIAFLVMFLRGSKLIWGIGLLTVSSAFLLDTLFGTFGRAAMEERLGFFFYVIAGMLFAGAALWLFGLLRPVALMPASSSGTGSAPVVPRPPRPATGAPPATETAGTAFDRQMLYEQIRDRMGPEDVLDLLFDLGINENEVMAPGQDMHDTIVRTMNLVEERGQTAALALAVERILTPIPPENLPRLEKLSPASPPTVLRHFLLTHYSSEELHSQATRLDVDWEQLNYLNKKSFVRSFLLYLYRRNRVDELIGLLQASSAAPEEAST